MHPKARKAFIVAGAVLMAGAMAHAQPLDPIDALLDAAGPTTPSTQPDQAPPRLVQTVSHPLSQADVAAFRQALEASRRGDLSGARYAAGQIADSLAHKVATWVMVDTFSGQLGFSDLDQARRDLAGWPRATRRQAAAERLLETSGLGPSQVVAWFAGAQPQTAQGAMALASAWRMQGRTQEAASLIRHWWRDQVFDVDVQRAMLARFGDMLTPDDHARRADILLYGPPNSAAREMIALLPADQQAAAQARLALRFNAGDANAQLAALPLTLAASPGVAFEHAAYLRRKGLDTLAAAELPNFPHEIVTADQADRVWDERYHLVLTALRNGDAHGAYAAADASGLTSGSDAAEAEFYAGWIALTRLNDPQAAGRHFAALEKIGVSPITRGRALYWQGRAAEARHDMGPAQAFYAAAAANSTTFYGLLAAEKLGQRLTLPADPPITSTDRLRFEGMDLVQAARLLNDQGQRDLFRVFVLHLDDVVPTTVDAALLVDLVRGYGEQDTSMKVVRATAQRGLILGERGYPFRTPPPAPGAAETALVMGITRQESGFDPLVRSGAGARGMMQLMPTTAAIIARRIGVDYSPAMLDEPDYNMRLGATFLGSLVGQFSGSYVMAIAGYNAGPARPIQWSAFCGDPRGGATDPVDFIECIPFSETRNYVMRVMEGMQVYRAKLAGGSTEITLSRDLKRGSYGYAQAMAAPAFSQP